MPERPKPIPQVITELRDLVIAYLRQETIDEGRKLAIYLAFGIGGWVLIAFGIVFAAIGLLRVLEDETGSAFDGNWSWVPYIIVIAVLAIVAIGVFAWATRRKQRTA